MGAVATRRPTKHAPKSFRFPAGITKREAGGVYRLHGQGEGIDCRDAGYRFQQLSVIALQRSAVRRNDPGAPFPRRFLERSNLKAFVLHSSTVASSQRDAKVSKGLQLA